MEVSMGFEPQNMGLNWVTYFLQMIVCFFVRKILFNGIDYFAFLVYMKLHSVRSLIVRRPPFFSVEIRALTRKQKSFAFQVCKRLNGVITILVYPFWLENLEFNLSKASKIGLGSGWITGWSFYLRWGKKFSWKL